MAKNILADEVVRKLRAGGNHVELIPLKETEIRPCLEPVLIGFARINSIGIVNIAYSCTGYFFIDKFLVKK